ncbi:MAG: acyltransferase [bacterium]|nr:acyltransferase [bacterium]
MNKNYFSLLDAVRFFAAFWVMNFHYLLVLGLSGDLHWYRYGNLGVQLFFIISGFVIVQSIQGKTFKEFFTGRFIRLFPIFWILCTVTYLVTVSVPNANPLSLNEYFISMTMLGDPINEASENNLGLIDASYWTLTVELIFYIVIGVFSFIFSTKNIRYFFLFWLSLSASAFLFNIDQNFYIKLALVRHTSYFVFGGALALIATKHAKSLYEKYFDYSLLVMSAIYSLYIHPKALPGYVTPNSLDLKIVTGLHLVFFVGTILAVYLSSFLKSEKTTRFLLVLGGLTYPLYLLHQTIGNTIINYMTNRFSLSWNMFALVFEIFIIGIAYVAYLQDKKMRGWLKIKFNL